ncbi:MAG: DUF262 domain-containing protein [Gemmatimonadetes bacterium]|nr:DUF262 domain-containing protein [Gemmatimonadota bacterium]MYB67853.1 DUF262 domain-containing protein [Gemmatimonadota bacterium]
MPIQRYSINQHSIETLLAWIKSDAIAIPEIQHPFVWNATKVRDFIDSLYNGYPVGYLITWRNRDVRLKDGTLSEGKLILIDGQQRVIALFAALHGEQVVNKDYKRTRISIAFHPGEERFEVANAAIRRDRGWIADVSTVFAPDARIRQLVDDYCEANHVADKYEIDDRMERLRGIRNNSLGVIELNADLEVETVAEIFVRINSQGVSLNAADFAMSKMAASEQYGGHLLRKCIDYFCHLAVAPEAYNDLAKDADFASTDYFRAMEWLKNEKDDLYDPSYTDMLRVTFTSQFKRGRLEDLVALLSGRNFETRTFEEATAEKAFHTLRDGILRYMNETNFKRFVMILRSAGFVDSSLIRSQNTVNFAYILFLTLRSQGEAPEQIETLVRRWFVMSILTSRYTGSPETAFGVDIGNIARQGASRYLDTIEQADLSDAFWKVGLPQQMDTSVASSPYFNVFLASQVKGNDKGFLSRDLTVRDLLEGQWHIHHVFPRSYLQKHGFQRGRYNQIANYVMMQSEINIAIGALPPEKYFSDLWEQCRNGATHYGGITDVDQLQENLAAHCIPEGMDAASVEDYDTFLQGRRELMAAKIRDYYKTL